MIARVREAPSRETPDRRASRRGITIIETLVLMTVVAAMLGLSALLLQLLLRLDGDGKARVDDAATLARLSRQFRQDAHAAASASPIRQRGAEPAALRLESAPRRVIEYQAGNGGVIVRLESNGGAQGRRETYRLALGGPIELGLVADGGRQFARLSISRRVSPHRADAPRAMEIIAAVGKNRDRTAGGSRPPGEKP